MGNCGMQIQCTMCLVPVEVNSNAGNRHLGQYQARQKQCTNRKLRDATGAKEVQDGINHLRGSFGK